MASDAEARRKRNIAVGFGVLQWLLLSFTLGTIIVYTDRSMEGLLGYQLDAGYAFFGACLIGFLMGATIERTRWLLLMVVSSCIAGAGIYVAVLFFPVWTGKLVHTVGLENFASTRAMLYFGLSIVPVSLGALAGRLLGSFLPGGDLLRRGGSGDVTGWWLDRPVRDESQQEVTRSSR